MRNTYRLVTADRRDVPRMIEFEANGPGSALQVAGRHCSGRDMEVFENGRSLGRFRNDVNGGFWVITPPCAKLTPATR